MFVTFYASNHDDALFYMGYTCGTASIITYGSPLSAVVRCGRFYAQLLVYYSTLAQN